MSNELKPCPFCGCEAEVLTMGTIRVGMRIGCPDCGASLECGATWLEAAQWNNRHDDHKAALAEREAELEKARELLKDALTTMEPDGHDTSYVHHDIAAYLGDKA